MDSEIVPLLALYSHPVTPERTAFKLLLLPIVTAALPLLSLLAVAIVAIRKSQRMAHPFQVGKILPLVVQIR
jgi:hypothetical protein